MKFITRVLLLATALLLPALSSAGTYVSITVAPPPLPVYAQPVCPGDGYIWTPGYWAWDGDEYYWVPGTWVLAPAVDVFWTPGYWGWGGGFYAWHAGYWGPHVGFYGGVNYGYGYGGVGYQGGRWERGRFHYNRAVNNINVVNVHNSYNATVINNGSRVSFNGGDGGVRAQPNAREIAAARDHHVGFTSVQRQHEQSARADRAMRFSENHGNPATAATQRPFNAGRADVAHGPDATSRGSQNRMPSSSFAPHANNGQGNVSRGHQINGVVNDRVEAPRGIVQSAPRSAMPSSGYAPRQQSQSRPQPGNGSMPQAMREAGPRGPVGNQMSGQIRGPGANPMNGGQMRGPHGGEHRAGPGLGAGQRPQAEHRREER